MKALRGLGYYAAFLAGACAGVGETTVALGCVAMMAFYLACETALGFAQ